MQGDDQTRFCGQCNLNVYNFSSMREKDVLQLIATKEGRICGRFYQRADGTLLTENCPVGLRVKIRKVSRIAGAALTAWMSVGFSAAQSNPQSPTSQVQAEEAGASILLQVLDLTGAVVPNAEVSLQTTSKEEIARGNSDDHGQLRLSHLPAGTYALIVKYAGFNPYYSSVFVAKNKALKIDATLRVGMMGEVVMVHTGPKGFFSKLGQKLKFK